MKKIIISLTVLFLYACDNSTNNIGENLAKDTLSVKIDSSNTILKPNLDSLSIENEIAISPFNKEDNMLYFVKKYKIITHSSKDLKPNEHDETIIDTLKTIYWGKSYIKTLTNNSIDRTLLQYASIDNNLISIRNNVRIGQGVEQVFKSLNASYNPTKKYKFLEVKSPDPEMNGTVSYLTFNFKGDTLSQITYWPWSD